MSTILNTNGQSLQIPEVTDSRNFRCHVIYAQWNPRITHALRDGALDVFHKAGLAESQIDVSAVSGSVELVNAAAAAINTKRYDAVIIIGCVIRGDTPHFDYVCQMAAQGTATLNARGEAPVIFGVLTVENEQQALDRAGGIYGNKGAEAAVAAIEMSNFHKRLLGF